MARCYVLMCDSCDNVVEIVEGWYYNGGWGNPRIREDIMAGKYGQEAKEAFSEHPSALYCIEANPYQCKGHFLGSRDDLCIFSNDMSAPELYFSTKHQCPVCNRVMRPWKRGKPICPRCKKEITYEPIEIWIE